MSNWTGKKLVVLDQFDGGSDVDLTTTEYTKSAGTAVIREDGTSKAYTKSTTSDSTWYLNNKNGYSNLQRVVSVKVNVLSANYRGGITIINEGLASTKYRIDAYIKRVGSNWTFEIAENDGGVDTTPVSQALTSAALQSTITITLLPNTIYWSVTNISDNYSDSFTPGDYYDSTDAKSGLFVQTPGISFGTSNKVEWQDFSVRNLPKGG